VLSPRACVELFHLVFLRALTARGDDKGLFALKGGCNLRFYFASVRYSEDIDLDVRVIARDTLRNKVDRLLSSPVVTSPLRAHGISIVDVSAPKQTETTQRWKAGLEVHGLSAPLRTKVEFSRRKAIEGAAFESVARELLKPYGLTPFLAPHYATRAAVAQKIHALAGRAEPQARDVFDLALLLARPDAATVVLTDDERRWLAPAIERAIGISYDEHLAKVVAYLEPEHAFLYESRDAWDALQSVVVASLEALQ